MRQYKFRAWDKVNNRMLFFDGFHWHDEYNLCHLGGSLDVPAGDNLEWMQSLDHPDKKGQLIYEGDIMKMKVSTQHYGKNNKTKEFLMVVVWNETECGFQLQEPGGTNMGNYRIHNGHWSAHEIVGNIYEHSQLLKP